MNGGEKWEESLSQWPVSCNHEIFFAANCREHSVGHCRRCTMAYILWMGRTIQAHCGVNTGSRYLLLMGITYQQIRILDYNSEDRSLICKPRFTLFTLYHFEWRSIGPAFNAPQNECAALPQCMVTYHKGLNPAIIQRGLVR